MDLLPRIKRHSLVINDRDDKDKLDSDRHTVQQEKEVQAINYLNQLSMQEIFEATPFDLFENLLRESNNLKKPKLSPTKTIPDDKRFAATANYDISMKKTTVERGSVTKRESVAISPRLMQVNIEPFKKLKKPKPIFKSVMNFLKKKRYHLNDNSAIKAHISARLSDLKMILSPKINQSQTSDNINSLEFENFEKDNQSLNHSFDISDYKELQSPYKKEYRNFPASQSPHKDKVKRKMFGIRTEHIKRILNPMASIPQLSCIPEQKGQQNYDFPGLLLIDETRTMSKDTQKVTKLKRKITSSESKLNIPSGENNIGKFDIILAEVQNPSENGAGKKLIAKQFPILKSLLPNQRIKSKISSPSRKIIVEKSNNLFGAVSVSFTLILSE